MRGSQTNLTPTLQKRLCQLTDLQLRKAYALVFAEITLRRDEWHHENIPAEISWAPYALSHEREK